MEDLKVITFEEHLQEAYLIKREKRFFVEFLWDQSVGVCENPQKFIAHTNNTGSMLGLLGEGRRILLSKASNPNRKLAWTLEAVSADLCKNKHKMLQKPDQYIRKNLQQNGEQEKIYLQSQEKWIGVNTSIPNKFLHNLFQLQCAFPEKNILPWAKGYNNIRMEATNGESRLDALLYYEDKKEQDKNSLQRLDKIKTSKKVVTTQKKKISTMELDTIPHLWVECKSVTLVEDAMAAFPDAVSERGTKHLESLIRIIKEYREKNSEEGQVYSRNNMESNEATIIQKKRAAMLYIIQRTDGTCFSPADYIDKKYSEKLLEAYKVGVEVYAIIANVQKDGIYYGGTLPLAPCFF